MRILITGSRDWVNPFVIGKAIEDYVEDVYMNAWNDPGPVIIVHGGCPTGADRWADLYAKAQGYSVEVYEAEWQRYGKAAGPKRNIKMVDSKPEVMLCFPKGKSIGTRGCMKYGREQRQHMKIYEGEEYDIS